MARATRRRIRHASAAAAEVQQPYRELVARLETCTPHQRYRVALWLLAHLNPADRDRALVRHLPDVILPELRTSPRLVAVTIVWFRSLLGAIHSEGARLQLLRLDPPIGTGLPPYLDNYPSMEDQSASP